MRSVYKHSGTKRTRVICDYLLQRLEKELPHNLYYHNLDHTLNVMQVCRRYACIYELTPHEWDLLMVASAGHDYGFLVSTENHEMIGSDLVSILMSSKDYTQQEIDLVKGMILSTKIPQSPKTLMDRILADSDLDYLGTDRYDEISERLFKELYELGKIKDRASWLNLQISFLEMHQYHTDWAKANREPIKQEVLDRLKSL